ncbi:Wadjet anti-phage system protein JetD domain-containing protein [Mycolicibacterium agri]|uniref:Wadjet anti-phage system protein JetD domain-containing protein n=1 Tax=Mycolicibacterium agri TaxID=36811 RepID=UPI001055F23B|nr:Wadjet anti-phage system protein JetD domain-containing protein [Mycolicibacterium agri]
MAEALVASGKVRVTRRELTALWARTAPKLVGEPGQVAGLAAALTELASDGVIKLPAGAWDTSTFPALPRSVRIPAARRDVRARPWTQFPWCGELGWIASLRTLSNAQFNDLVAVNSWLADTRGIDVPIVPMRYRSVQLFGDEKRLERLARSSPLFGPGLLNLELLVCRRFPPPLAAAEVGSGLDLLVVENSDTYWVAVEALRNHLTAHPVGVVAWGCGKSFPAQTPTLTIDVAGRGPVGGTVWYWGDMDPEGLAIAVDAATASTHLGGPPVRPATALWAAMADRPVQAVGTVTWSDIGREWLGRDLHANFAAVRSARGRVAQEAVPATVITEWAAALRPHRGEPA